MNDAILSPAPRGMPGGPKVLLYVFGCQMNKLDAELTVGELRRAGYDFTDRDEEAQVVLLVTCSVRDQAENRVRSLLGELGLARRVRPELVVGLMGCMAQREGGDLLDRWPVLDFVVGTRDFTGLPLVLDRVRADGARLAVVDGPPEDTPGQRDVSLRPHRSRAFVAVMRGCDKPCTYCIVPRTRGSEVSRPLASVLDEVRRLVDDGVVEVTLLGQTVNAWGRREGRSLGDLLACLEEVAGLERIRFITSHPAEMDESLIDALARSSKCGHFLHLPPQSGSTRVLRRMARGYSAESYREAVQKLRERVPGIQIGADFILGFPGETDGDFDQTLALLEDLRFSQAFLFRYSPRPDTPAFGRLEDDVPQSVKRQRLATLMSAQSRIMLARHRRLIGSTHEVLVEGASRRDARLLFGRNRAFDRIVFEGEPACTGHFANVTVTEATALTLRGRRTRPAALAAT